MHRILVILIIFSLSSCSTFTAASVSSNIVTVTATGKTNADHIVSYFAGKDCKFFRAAVEKEICKEDNSVMALKQRKTKQKNDINNKFVKKVVDTTLIVTKNVARDHVVLGAKIADRIGITNELEKKVKTRFENTEKKEKSKKSESKKNIAVKKNSNNMKDNKIAWKQRVERLKTKKDEFIEETKIQKNEFIEETKIQKNELVEEAKVKKDELVEEAKVKKDELVEEAKVKKDELVEGIKAKRNELAKDAKIKRKELVEGIKAKRNELAKDAKIKRKELKENFLKNVKKVKLYSSYSNSYALNPQK